MNKVNQTSRSLGLNSNDQANHVRIQYMDALNGEKIPSSWPIISENDLNAAVSLFLESDGKLISSKKSSEPGSSKAKENIYSRDTKENLGENVRAPIASRRDVLIDYDYSGSSSSYFGQHTRSSFRNNESMRTPTDPFRSFDSESELYATGNFASDDQPRNLSELFRAPVDIAFRGDFEKAKSYAVSREKWLLINIQSMDSFECQVLNRDLWKDRAVKDIVKKNFVFCQYISGTESAELFKRFYNAVDMPHVSIIDPRTGEQLYSWGPSINTSSFSSELINFLFNNQWNLPNSNLPSSSKLETDPSSLTEEESLRSAINASLNNNINYYQSNSDLFVNDINDSDYLDSDVDSFSSDYGSKNRLQDEIVISDYDSDESYEHEKILVESHPTRKATTINESLSSTSIDIDMLKSLNNNHVSTPISSDKCDDLGYTNNGENTDDSDSLQNSFDLIPAIDHPDKPISSETTRVQFRYPDGKKTVKIFNKSDRVLHIFQFAKYSVGPENHSTVEVTFNRKKLWDDIKKSIDEAGLCNSAITVEY
ncbi:UBX domain-containing protein 7 [Smittium culicis]|uniref:UBX domain-containing protein 7 n=1 Tax=Smittium culicis TaxID=133412 RepID=A0A1R1YSP3_9FUNG|nr:UBX domain-containing protein 7 [Smittium culicis]